MTVNIEPYCYSVAIDGMDAGALIKEGNQWLFESNDMLLGVHSLFVIGEKLDMLNAEIDKKKLNKKEEQAK